MNMVNEKLNSTICTFLKRYVQLQYPETRKYFQVTNLVNYSNLLCTSRWFFQSSVILLLKNNQEPIFTHLYNIIHLWFIQTWIFNKHFIIFFILQVHIQCVNMRIYILNTGKCTYPQLGPIIHFGTSSTCSTYICVYSIGCLYLTQTS